MARELWHHFPLLGRENLKLGDMIREYGDGVRELSVGLKKCWRYFRQLFILLRDNIVYFQTLLPSAGKFRRYFTQQGDERKKLGRQMQQYLLAIKTNDPTI